MEHYFHACLELFHLSLIYFGVELSKKVQVSLMLQYLVLLFFYCSVLIFFRFIIINKSELYEWEFISIIISVFNFYSCLR